ncbi:Hypothetical protein A7982_00972 [Minicystis rosea]|nr:Hypothetical protein A7982_00972 [Minicystis rosea]
MSSAGVALRPIAANRAGAPIKPQSSNERRTYHHPTQVHRNPPVRTAPLEPTRLVEAGTLIGSYFRGVPPSRRCGPKWWTASGTPIARTPCVRSVAPHSNASREIDEGLRMTMPAQYSTTGKSTTGEGPRCPRASRMDA